MPPAIGSGGSATAGGPHRPALLDQIGQAPCLCLRGEHQVDLLLDLALDRIQRDDAGLADPAANKSRDLDPPTAFRHDIEAGMRGQDLPHARERRHGLPLGR